MFVVQNENAAAEEELIPKQRSLLEGLAYCPLNMIVDDLMLISEQVMPVIYPKPIKRYYITAKEIEEIASKLMKNM